MWVALLSSATTAAQIREATDMIDLCAAEISSLVEQITSPVD